MAKETNPDTQLNGAEKPSVTTTQFNELVSCMHFLEK
jgi:hypothetical protein